MAHNIIIIKKIAEQPHEIFNDGSAQYPISYDWYDLEVTLEGSDLESCSPIWHPSITVLYALCHLHFLACLDHPW